MAKLTAELTGLDMNKLENILETIGISFKEYEDLLDPTVNVVRISEPIDYNCLKFKVIEFHFKNGIYDFERGYEETSEPTSVVDEANIKGIAELIRKNPYIIRSLDNFDIVKEARKVNLAFDSTNKIYIPADNFGFYYNIKVNDKNYRINVVHEELYNERIF